MSKKQIKIFFICLILLFSFLTTWLYLFSNTLEKKEKMIFIPKGADTLAIANILYTNQIIKNKFKFRLYTRVFSLDRYLKAGSFKVSSQMSLKQITDILTKENGVAALIRVVIPEGYTIEKIARLLEEREVINKKEFLEYLKNKAYSELKNKYLFIKFAPQYNLEGYLFPNTYLFSKTDTPKIITETFLQKFKKEIVLLWRAHEAKKDSPKKRFNFYEVITMASIIEKEAATKEEMPLISSVFYNRLKKRQPLAADPTVVYALGRTHKKIVTYKDTRVNSAYNTYKNTGFPPTPIASFGVAAFKAALSPANTEYLFFVANPGTKTHSFTKTYKEHLAIQRRFKK